jgi:hypothetical protein
LIHTFSLLVRINKSDHLDKYSLKTLKLLLKFSDAEIAESKDKNAENTIDLVKTMQMLLGKLKKHPELSVPPNIQFTLQKIIQSQQTLQELNERLLIDLLVCNSYFKLLGIHADKAVANSRVIANEILRRDNLSKLSGHQLFTIINSFSSLQADKELFTGLNLTLSKTTLTWM